LCYAQVVTDIRDVQACLPNELIDKLTSLIASHSISLLYCDYGLNSRTPLPAEIIDRVRSAFPKIIIESLPQELLHMRMIKDPGEIELIKDGIAIVEKIFSNLAEVITPGLAEAELASLIYKDLVQNGFNRFYDIFVASGPNSAKPFYRANNCLLPPNHVVLVDICAARGNYVCDLTRTFPTSGVFPSHWSELYSLVCEVQQQAKKLVRSGRTLHELSEKVKSLFEVTGLDKFYLNKLGHFVGLAPDDPGDQNSPLQKGMVVTIEPGLYLSEVGLRIEDTVVVEN
jgi:Xaa-Pro aminopeptidase